MQEIGYGVVWPLGKRASEKVTLVPRITDLKNKTICELSDYGFKAEEIFPLLDYTNFGNTHGPQEAKMVAGLPEKLRQYGCDAVISGVGG
jgi:hypothetical protein